MLLASQRHSADYCNLAIVLRLTTLQDPVGELTAFHAVLFCTCQRERKIKNLLWEGVEGM